MKGTALICGILCVAGVAFTRSAAAEERRAAVTREYAFDLWDWTTPCRDLSQFRTWVADLKSIGVNRIEISAPWNLLEPRPGEYDLSFIADRLAVAKQHGLGLRVRINSYYNGATPAWYDGDFWRDVNGNPPTGTPIPPSINDPRFWQRYGPLCTEIARAFCGEDVIYSPFIGIHAELKWADWWSYDPASLAAWKRAIDARPRPQWLSDVAGELPLPDVPPVPRPTSGTPDNTPEIKAWIAFREQSWRDAVRRFNDALRAGDPHARTSAPLGESFRRGSADMSNLDYFGLSRGMDQIVHSYDFFWHPKDDAWMAGAAVASFRGISGVRDIGFEFDGPALVERLGYDVDHQLRIARAALAEGAGLKAANYSYDARLPSEWHILRAFGKLIDEAGPPLAPSRPDQTILLFVGKWANLCYREPTEWLHDAQFGAWQMLRETGHNVRFICEDNLAEDLGGYRGVYVAFSPPELLPARDRERLDRLVKQIPSIVELSRAPDAPPHPAGPKGAPAADGRAVTLDHPLAFNWLRGDRAASRRLLDQAVSTTWGSRR